MTAHAKANPNSSHLGYAVREALESVLSPALRERVLREALERCKRTTVPEEPMQFKAFVQGPLRRALEAILGLNGADTVVADLERMLESALEGSDIRPAKTMSLVPLLSDSPELEILQSSDPMDLSHPSLGKTASKRRGSTAVVLATLSPSSVEALAAAVGTEIAVHAVHDLFSLFHALETNARSQPVIVIDCEMPAVRPATLAAMTPELPEGATVVLWKATPQVEAELMGVAKVVEDWMRCGPQTSIDELSSVCTLLNAYT